MNNKYSEKNYNKPICYSVQLGVNLINLDLVGIYDPRTILSGRKVCVGGGGGWFEG